MSDPFDPLSDSEKRKQAQGAADEWVAVLPVPEDALEPTFSHRDLGEPSATWAYRDGEGRLLGHVCRFDVNGSKELRPRFFCKGSAGKSRWRWKAPPKPRPLFGLDQLAQKPDATVLATEGEKAACAARKRFPELVVVAPMNGAGSAHLTDWTPLCDRDVIVWGDNDDAGSKFAKEVGREARGAGATSMRSVRVPESFPPKWDLADRLPDGVVEDVLHQLLADAHQDLGVENPILVSLADRAKRNVRAAFEQPVLNALAEQQLDNAAVFQALLADLKGAGVPLRDLRTAVRRASFRVIRGGEQSSSNADCAGPYSIENGMLTHSKATAFGNVANPIANFSARITSEEIRDDGLETHMFLILEGALQNGRILPRIEVSTDRFGSGGWVLKDWGSRAILFAIPSHREHLRAAIQMLSGEVPRERVYTHIGWTDLDGEMVYLHVGGAIGAGGAVEGVRVAPPQALDRYELPPPPDGEALCESARALLRCIEIAPDRIMLPLLGALGRSVVSPADLTIWLSGLTGIGKSELAAIIQGFFGARFDAKSLPENWSSTANALEMVCFSAQSAIVTVDDYAPQQARSESMEYQRKADRLLRGVGNRSGRSRMRADGTLRPTRAPRCLLISTGEDLPANQSIRARSVILEVEPKDVDWEHLTVSQSDAREGRLAAFLSGFIRWVAGRRQDALSRVGQSVEAWRERSFDHRRHADSMGQLAAGFDLLMDFAAEVGVLGEDQHQQLLGVAEAALLAVGHAQAEHQRLADPVGRFLGLLSGAFVAGRIHLLDTAGEKPEDAARWGWQGDSPQGSCVGWIQGSDVFLSPEVAFAAVQQLAGSQASGLGLSQTVLWKRCGERGLLVSSQEGRNTTQRLLAGHRRRVLHFATSTISSGETGVCGASGAEEPETASPDARAPSSTDPSTNRGGQSGAETGAGEASGTTRSHEGDSDTSRTTNTSFSEEGVPQDSDFDEDLAEPVEIL